jgi:hypothetical protein
MPPFDMAAFEAELQPLFDEATTVQVKLQRTLALVDQRLVDVRMSSGVSSSEPSGQPPPGRTIDLDLGGSLQF